MDSIPHAEDELEAVAPSHGSHSPGQLHPNFEHPQRFPDFGWHFHLQHSEGMFRVRITISRYRVFISCDDIILATVQNKNRHCPTAAMISHWVSLTDNNASWNSAN